MAKRIVSSISYRPETLEWVDEARGRVGRSRFVNDILIEKMNETKIQ